LMPRHGINTGGLKRSALHKSFLDAFAKHGVAEAYGFVNGQRMKDADDRAALAAWVAAGHALGNHAFSHADPDAMPLAQYLEDIQKNEPLLGELMGDDAVSRRRWRVYRFPYLRQGSSLESRLQVRAFLAERGYRVADVSIDYADWAYTDPYSRCIEKNDKDAIAALVESALEHAEAELAWSEAAACELIGRPIKHILLMHVSAFSARTVDAVLERYKKKGVRFITYDEAMKDAVYTAEPAPPRSWRGPLLYQIRASRQRATPPIPVTPDPALWGVCT